MDLERSLNLGFGFPAVVAVSPSKQKVSTMKGAFDDSNFTGFLNDLISGRTGHHDLKSKLVFKKADNWDGNDAKPIDDGYDDL